MLDEFVNGTSGERAHDPPLDRLIHFRPHGGVPEPTLICARVLTLTEAEAGDGAEVAVGGGIVSTFNELAAHMYLQRAARAISDAHLTSIEADELIVSEPRLREAPDLPLVRVRLGEKLILRHSLAALDERIEELKAQYVREATAVGSALSTSVGGPRSGTPASTTRMAAERASGEARGGAPGASRARRRPPRQKAWRGSSVDAHDEL